MFVLKLYQNEPPKPNRLLFEDRTLMRKINANTKTLIITPTMRCDPHTMGVRPIPHRGRLIISLSLSLSLFLSLITPTRDRTVPGLTPPDGP